jgi:hypothetical protein
MKNLGLLMLLVAASATGLAYERVVVIEEAYSET